MQLKAFISYSSKDKLIGGKIKEKLDSFSIEGFLAHDDIYVAEEWKQRIREELSKSDIFIPLLSKNFKESDWCQQELGIAYYRDIFIIPLQLDANTNPFGFINHIQGKQFEFRFIECQGMRIIQEHSDLLTYLIQPIVGEFPSPMIPAVIKELERAGSYCYAERVMELLVPYFDKFKREDIDTFIDAAINNNQIFVAALCRGEYLPKFIEINKDKINSENLEILSYQ